jgi:hypothetical protein
LGRGVVEEMTRIRLIGLALLAGLVMSATATATASAETIPPELGECLETTPAKSGEYTNAGCTKKVGTPKTGKYEWSEKAGAGKEGFTFASRGAVTIETVGKGKITCKKGVSSTQGKYVGQFEAEAMKVTFAECEDFVLKAKCQNTATAGEIVINTLSKLGVIAPKEIGVDLVAPPPATALAKYECGGVEIIITGSVIAKETATNKMLKTFTQDFKAAKGIQKPTMFEGEPEDVLTVEVPAQKTIKQAGLTATLTISNSSPLEIRDED